MSQAPACLNGTAKGGGRGQCQRTRTHRGLPVGHDGCSTGDNGNPLPAQRGEGGAHHRPCAQAPDSITGELMRAVAHRAPSTTKCRCPAPLDGCARRMSSCPVLRGWCRAAHAFCAGSAGRTFCAMRCGWSGELSVRRVSRGRSHDLAPHAVQTAGTQRCNTLNDPERLPMGRRGRMHLVCPLNRVNLRPVA